MDVIEGVYVYRLDGVVVPIDESFLVRGRSWFSQRAAGDVTIEVEATYGEAGEVDRAVVRWRSGASVDVEVTRTGEAVVWSRVRMDVAGRESSESRFPSGALVFPLLRCFQGATVRALAESGEHGREVLVPDITDPADPVRLLTPRLDVRRAAREDDGTYRYVGGSYEDGALCEVGADGVLERYRWDQKGVGLWDVRLRRSGPGGTT